MLEDLEEWKRSCLAAEFVRHTFLHGRGSYRLHREAALLEGCPTFEDTVCH